MAKLTGWRRVASAMWGPPSDAQIYGALDVDAGPTLAFLARARAAGHHVTVTHLVGKAVAHALAEVPDLNVRIRGSRAVTRSSIDIFFITAVQGGHDLSGVKVPHVSERPVVEVAAELARRAARLKAGEDREFSRSKKVMDHLPQPLLRAALRATAYLTNALQLELPMLGLHPSPFGSAMVTSVGMFGLPQGFAPLAWMYDVPLLVLVGEVSERAEVVDHQVVPRQVLPLTATIDHRYVDGWHVSRLVRAFRDYLAAPEAFEPPFTAAAAEGEEGRAAEALAPDGLPEARDEEGELLDQGA
ncbi:MAG TPA: 2-oxo acid dehydrogenase subunit E2 [Kofleriaceae bacterium]|nr:2-oxo acid dehydrogenase subunit E2 [Kofleriaceae bacterium]